MGYDRDYGRGDRGGYRPTGNDDTRYERGRYGRDDRDRFASRDEHDRGFFDRAGDEVRSWFGDEEAERRRRYDELQDQRSGYGASRETSDRYGSAERGYGQNDRGYGQSDRGQGGRGNPSQGGYSGYGGPDSGRTTQRGGGYDRQGGSDYDRWRQQQIDALDRDYHDYRQENQSRFESDFGSWRNQRQSQRTHLQRVDEHMEVVGSDGEHLGTVDKVRGDRIILTKADPAAGGHHHSIPCSWIDSVDDKVKVSKTAEEAKNQWRDEERRQALFSEDDQRSEGPHILNRSFSGTYER